MTKNNNLDNSVIKAQLRRIRYEESTLNKPITVRAHPDRHEFLKIYAKTGKCSICSKTNKMLQKEINNFYRQVNFPQWSDRFTTRDTVISLYTLFYVEIIYIVNDILKNITF